MIPQEFSRHVGALFAILGLAWGTSGCSPSPVPTATNSPDVGSPKSAEPQPPEVQPTPVRPIPDDVPEEPAPSEKPAVLPIPD